MSAAELESVREAMARGDVLIAYDEAMAAVDHDPDDLDARYLAALSLARSGAAHRALDVAEELQARLDATDSVPVNLREDVAALQARIVKTEALEAGGEQRATLLARAAAHYAAIADRYGGYYAAINASTLTLLAGDHAAAVPLARRAWDLAVAEDAGPGAGSYWTAATEAEAALIVGDIDAATDALDRAAQFSVGDFGARATTRRQLLLVCAAMSTDPDVLAPLSLPAVLHYCGHVIGGDPATTRFLAADEDRVSTEIRAFLDARDAGFAFGSLASGADILIAEATIARGTELHAVLPFDQVEFEAISVRPAGEAWVQRFRQCLAAATTVTQACDSAYLDDNALFAYASHIAMGHARNRAAILGIEAEQLAVWDGQPARGVGGTADDVALWQRTGGTTSVISLPATGTVMPAPAVTREPVLVGRTVQALLFADFHGFSTLRDEHYDPTFVHIYQPLAAVLDRHGDAVLWRNTWGDAIVAVFADVTTAGQCALELQEVNEAIDRTALTLPSELGLRIAVHVGPLLARNDPFRTGLAFWGREMTRAARIEPRTPEGHVYATDAFAALLALEPDSGIDSEYVGRMTTAKDFETIPMYRLRRASEERRSSGTP